MRRAACALICFVLIASGCTLTRRAQPTAPPPPRPTPAPSPSPSPSPEPSPTLPAVFAVKGDWGASSAAQRAITARMCAVADEAGFEDVVTTGDNFYPSGQATADNYDEPERCLYSRPGHRWRPTWGNHDVSASSTADVLGAPSRWYRWSLESIDFFMLDSSQTASADQKSWLDANLSESTAPLKIVVFHAPPFTSGRPHRGDAGVLKNWVPLFHEHAVALVLAGHQHIYEHLVVEDIHYVVTGGGGAALYRCADSGSPLVVCIAEHHFLIVSATGSPTGTWVTVSAIGLDGAEIDAFSFTKQAP